MYFFASASGAAFRGAASRGAASRDAAFRDAAFRRIRTENLRVLKVRVGSTGLAHQHYFNRSAGRLPTTEKDAELKMPPERVKLRGHQLATSGGGAR
jgi:hypothetical protein